MQQNLFPDKLDKEVVYERSDIIVLSLQPYAYEKIKGGGKRMEYRTRFRKRPTIAVLYVSAPVMEIRGLIFMGKPIIDTPEKIGVIAEEKMLGNGASVYEYLKGRKQGYAIPILQYIEIEPIPLAALRAEYNFIVPQSYIGIAHYKGFDNYIIEVIESIRPDINI